MKWDKFFGIILGAIGGVLLGIGVTDPYGPPLALLVGSLFLICLGVYFVFVKNGKPEQR